jgi:mRNA interferase RelE/StbE
VTYAIVFAASAKRELAKLERSIQMRILAHVLALATNPRPSNTKKLAGQDAYRIRVGDYRAIYTVEDTTRVVTIIKVGRRDEVYK